MTQPQAEQLRVAIIEVLSSLTPDEVNKLHAKADKDASTFAAHHSLGIQANQATAGDHVHDGRSSRRIGAGLDPTFPTTAGVAYTATQIQSIIDALRDLGFGMS